MKVISYLNSVPRINNNPQKTLLLHDFIAGVRVAGDEGILHSGDNLLECDVSVIQGWVYSQITTPHLRLRNAIIQAQKTHNKHTVVADGSLFLYKDKVNPHGYLRYSLNGIFPTTGEYCDSKIDPGRWKSISKTLGITIEDYKRQGSHILLMCQRQGGWSMKGYDVVEWIKNTVENIQQFTDKKIIIRSHPGDKRAVSYLKKRQGHPLLTLQNVEISPSGRPLEHDLHNARAVDNHNSSAAVGPIIKGYHCFLTDPKDSQCKEVSHNDFRNIENPKEFNREDWLRRISMCHWSFHELKSGTCWKHMREFVQ